ncbi:hypothetical protein HDU85_006861 [Gaertneriomyces sp. JEL0708]|nr:hypothetical protein HDU85_006861 [Gaertneriomyces sp. JEL0708]
MEEEQQKSIAAAHPEVEESAVQAGVHENVQKEIATPAEDTPKPKVKRQMTAKQKAALDAAREKRTARLREMSKQKAEEDERKRLEEAKRLLEEEKAKKKAARLAKATTKETKTPVKETKAKEPAAKKKPVKTKAAAVEYSEPNIKVQPTNPIATRLYDQQAEVMFHNPYDIIFGNTYRK